MTTLYTESSAGKLQQWSVWTEEVDQVVSIIREHGYVDGKIQRVSKVVPKGTNIGKANEKTAKELADDKVTKMIKDRIEDNWHLDIDEAGVIKFLKPMLAAGFNPKKLKFPCYVQPKMDGARCTSYRHLDDETMWSRQRKEFNNVNHIKDRIKNTFGKFSPDGELYIHGETFQHIISLVKKYRPRLTEAVQYWIYDLAIPTKTFAERKDILDDMLDFINPGDALPFVKVQTDLVNNIKELNTKMAEYIELEYEGAIIRDPDALYEFNGRSIGLMKYKLFQDEEFRVIDTEVEVWHDTVNDVHRDLIIYVCETKDHNEFRTRPTGSMLKREEDYKVKESFIGKWLTVRFQNYSPDGIPIFPVGKGIREGKVVDGIFIPEI